MVVRKMQLVCLLIVMFLIITALPGVGMLDELKPEPIFFDCVIACPSLTTFDISAVALALNSIYPLDQFDFELNSIIPILLSKHEISLALGVDEFPGRISKLIFGNSFHNSR